MNGTSKAVRFRMELGMLPTLEKLVGGKSQLKPEYYTSNRDCLRPERWHMHPLDGSDEGVCSSEMEVVLFLQALIMVLKPMVLVELGTNAGIFTEYAARVMPKKARLITFEHDARLAAMAGIRLAQYPDVMLIQSDAVSAGNTWPPTAGVDFLFVDTGEFRISEMRAWTPKLSQYGIMAVHDTDTVRYNRRETETIAEEFKMQLLHLPTPRGLTLMRRAS